MKIKFKKRYLVLVGAVFLVAVFLFFSHERLEYGGEEIVRNENPPKIEKDEYLNYLMTEKFPERFFWGINNLVKLPQEVEEYLLDHYDANSILSENVEVYVFDLNGDTSDEYLVIPWKIDGELFRGASGNGSILVLSSEEDGIKLLGEPQGNSFFVAKEKANGYHNILTHWHMGALNGSETMYKFSENSDGKMEYQEDFKQMYELEQQPEQIRDFDISYNQVLDAAKKRDGSADIFKGKSIKWQAKISAYYSQISGIKFCVVDDEHQNVDISESCDWFWASSDEIMGANDLKINPSWDGRWVPYTLNYYGVTFDENDRYYDEVYTVVGKISGVGCDEPDPEFPDYVCIMDVDIVEILKEGDLSGYPDTVVVNYKPPENFKGETTKDYSCRSSKSAFYRSDAFTCKGRDPCFYLPNENAVFCPSLSSLQEGKSNTESGVKLEMPEFSDIEPKIPETEYDGNKAWAVELFDGEICGFVTGAGAISYGERENYSCGLFGNLKKGRVWTIRGASLEHTKEEGFTTKSSEMIPVKTVWQ